MDNKRADSVIQTKRLLLREITEDDAERIVKWRSDPKVYKYFKYPHALSIEEHKYWYRTVYLSNSNLISWMAMESDTPIGIFSAKRLVSGECEVSYLLDQNYHKRGYATEVLKAIEGWGFYNWNTNRFIAEINNENESSVNFIKKLGYREKNRVGDFRIYELKLRS